MSVMGIAILLIIILFALWGMKKGLVRSISGILSLVISCVLVNFLLPHVAVVLKERTPVYTFIEKRCEDLVNSRAAQMIPKNVLRDYAASMGFSDEQLTAMEQSAGGLSGALEAAGVSVRDTGMELLAGLSRTEQTSLIRSLPIPDFLKKTIESYNNSEGYKKLEAFNFAEYLVHFIADLLIHVVTFAVTMILTWLIVRLIIGSLHLFSSLPLIGTLDRIGGLLCGALEGIFFVWLLLLILSLFSGTKAGMAIQEMIDGSMTLWPVVESNVFMKIITNTVSKVL